MSDSKMNSAERVEARELNAPAQNKSVDAVDGAIVDAMVSGEVAETAKDVASQNSTGQKGDDDDAQQAQQSKKDDGALDQREVLRQRLLAKAPKQSVMRTQVKRELEKKKVKLESEVRKHRKKKNYHALTKAIMQLRMVMRQLETLAKIGAERLQSMWLELVHKFA